jgi:hypothetical protein
MAEVGAPGHGGARQRGERGRGGATGGGMGAARGRHGEMLRALLPVRGYSATHSVRSVREEENNRKEDGERRRKRQGRKRKEKKRKEKEKKKKYGKKFKLENF